MLVLIRAFDSRTIHVMGQVLLADIHTNHVLESARNSGFAMGLCFGKVDYHVRIQQILRDKVFVPVLSMMAFELSRIIIGDAKPVYAIMRETPKATLFSKINDLPLDTFYKHLLKSTRLIIRF